MATVTARFIPMLKTVLEPVIIHDPAISPAPIYRESGLQTRPSTQADPMEFDCVIYHLGNSAAHRFVYECALKRPGIVVLHDYAIHEAVAFAFFRDDPARYHSLLQEAYGTGWVDVLHAVQAGPPAQFFLEHPLIEPVVRSSRVVVTHSEFTRRLVLSGFPDIPTYVIPLQRISAPEGHCDVQEARQALGLPPIALTLGSFGYANSTRHLDLVLSAVSLCKAKGTRFFFIHAGSCDDRESLVQMAESLGIGEQVRVLGHVDDLTYSRYMCASDVVMNLRWPTRGETSAISLEALAHGKPHIVCDAGSFAEFPDSVVAKLTIGSGIPTSETVTDLASLLQGLADPMVRSWLGRRACAYFEHAYDPTLSTTLYAHAVQRCLRPCS